MLVVGSFFLCSAYFYVDFFCVLSVQLGGVLLDGLMATHCCSFLLN